MRHPMKLEFTRKCLLVSLANHYRLHYRGGAWGFDDVEEIARRRYSLYQRRNFRGASTIGKLAGVRCQEDYYEEYKLSLVNFCLGKYNFSLDTFWTFWRKWMFPSVFIYDLVDTASVSILFSAHLLFWRILTFPSLSW